MRYVSLIVIGERVTEWLSLVLPKVLSSDGIICKYLLL